MTDRRESLALVVLATLAVGIAVRAAVLVWSPLPATLDGFRYAALARDVVETGRLPLSHLDADELVFTLILAVASDLTGIRPLMLAQPLVACLGGASILGVVALAVRVTPDAWSSRRVRYVAATVGLTFAIQGLYLRRSGVPDEEAVSLLLLPLFALAVHRTFERRTARWTSITVLFAVVYPLLHNFSSVIAALTLTALAACHLVRSPTRRMAVGAGLVPAVFWAYLFGYYELAARFGLRLTYSGLIRSHLGVFIGWVVLLVVLVAWLQTTTDRARRTTMALGLVPLFGIAGVNLLVPVFPGTVQTPPLVLALVVVFLVPVLLFVWATPRFTSREGPLVLALATGPLAMVWFALTTALVPQFFDALLRAQTFAHHAVFALAGIAAVGIGRTRPWLGRVAVAALVIAAVVSVPLGFIHLDTGTSPRTVHTSEFEAASFATLHTTEYTSDQRLSRVGPLYYQRGATTSMGPTRSWLTGGPPPGCPTLVQESWTVTGAHFYPTAPATIAPARFDRWLDRNNRVYTVGGTTTTSLVVPRNGAGSC